jgi:hypothetical protein
MILKIASDAAYLVQPKACSCAAAHYHLGWRNSKQTNGPVDVLCKTIKNIVSSTAEAETGSIYMSAQHACPMRTALKELGHPQPITGTPFETDNSTAQGILTLKMRQKLSKSFDMRYVVLVDEGPHQPGPIQPHLGLRQVQLGRLLHQASPTMASSQHALPIHPASELSAQEHNEQVSVRGCVRVPRPTWHGNFGTQSTLTQYTIDSSMLAASELPNIIRIIILL